MFSITSGVFSRKQQFLVLMFRIDFLSFAGSTSQLIVHSSRVRTPQRHNSESVLYMNDDQVSLSSVNNNNNNNKTLQTEQQSSRNNHRLFPVNTYTESNKSPEPKLQLQNNQSPDKQTIK